MIVKNEEAILERCLRSVLPFLSSWTVVDTGSTDATPNIVQSLLGHLPGKLHHQPWVDFAHNRSQAFRFNREQCQYHLVIDADDWLQPEAGFQMPPLQDDCYFLEVHLDSLSFQRPQIFRSALPWRYEGVLHEYAECSQPYRRSHLKGLRYYCGSGVSARSQNPSKYLEDAQLLERALEKDPENTRYAFYLGQSYRDAGLTEKAIQAYSRRLAMAGWSEELYLSHLHLGRLYEDWQRRHLHLVQAYQINPQRAESLVELARLHREQNQWNLALLFAQSAITLPLPSDGLFLEQPAYHWRGLDELALALHYTGNPSQAARITHQLLESGLVPPADQERLRQNLTFYPE